METYTIIKKGENIQHCLKIPAEFVDKELEIIIKPIRKGGNFKKKLELLFNKNRNVHPFASIPDPMEWQKEQRNGW